MDPNLQNTFRKEYLKLAHPEPKFRIETLKDYYLYREDLLDYQYNNRLMLDLIQLNLTCFDVPKRIDRFGMLKNTINFIIETKPMFRYVRNPGTQLKAKPSTEVIEGVFQIFQRVTTDKVNLVINEKVGRSVYWFFVNFLTKVKLSDEQWDWVLAQAIENEYVRPVIETATVPHEKIAKWVEQHFQLDFVASQRARYTAHLIDWNHDFELTNEQILRDCEQLNILDQAYIDQVIDTYNQQQLLDSIWETEEPTDWLEELKNVPVFKYSMDGLLKDDGFRKLTPEEEEEEYSLVRCRSFSEFHRNQMKSEFCGFHLSYCFLPHSRRLYPVPTKEEKEGRVFFPDFEAARKELESNVDLARSKYMLWAIAESRLTNAAKAKLMKKYWHEDLSKTWLHIAKAKKNAEMLKGFI